MQTRRYSRLRVACGGIQQGCEGPFHRAPGGRESGLEVAAHALRMGPKPWLVKALHGWYTEGAS